MQLNSSSKDTSHAVIKESEEEENEDDLPIRFVVCRFCDLIL